MKLGGAVKKLYGALKKVQVFDISAEMLKARGEAMIHRLYAVLSHVYQSDALPRDWKRD